jgi:PadR family transcriptional regulator AphA
MDRQPIRLTGTSYAVLGLIDQAGEATPYELKRRLEESIANFWPVQHTTFYAEPARLAAAGYLDEDQEEGGRRRKRYTLTEQGRAALAGWLADTDFVPPQVRDEQMLRMFLGADPRPLVEARVDWHRRKLAELEGYLAEVRAAGGPVGVERSLIAGTAYHRMLGDAFAASLAEGVSAVEGRGSA